MAATGALAGGIGVSMVKVVTIGVGLCGESLEALEKAAKDFFLAVQYIGCTG